MRKYLILLFSLFILCSQSEAGVLIGSGAVGSAVEPYVQWDWTGAGATDEVCQTTPCPDSWTNIADTPGFLSVSGGALLITTTADTNQTHVYATRSGGEPLENFTADDEFWVEFKIAFSTSDNLQTSGTGEWMDVRFNSPGIKDQQLIKIDTTSGSMVDVNAEYNNDAGVQEVCGSDVAWVPVDDTQYTVRWYWKRDSDGGADGGGDDGVVRWVIVGEFSTCEQTGVDNDTITDFYSFYAGQWSAIHDGSNNYTVTIDDVKIYDTDPGWSW